MIDPSFDGCAQVGVHEGLWSVIECVHQGAGHAHLFALPQHEIAVHGELCSIDLNQHVVHHANRVMFRAFAV